MATKIRKKNRSHRYDINRRWSRHWQKYGESKTCLSMMISLCIKHHISNIWSSIHEKVKQNWDWAEKSNAY